MATGQEIWAIKGGTYVHAVGFSPDGHILASGSGGSVRLWEMGLVCRSAFCTPRDISALRRRKQERGRRLSLLKARLRKGERIATLRGCIESWQEDHFALLSPFHALLRDIWAGMPVDASRLVILSFLKGHARCVRSLAFSPDGRMLASGSGDRSIRLWEVASGHEMYSFEGHTDDVNSVAFSPVGRLLASGSRDGTVRLWDVDARKEMRLLKGHQGSVTSLVFSPDGRHLASAGTDATIRLWDPANGWKEEKVLKGQAAVESIAFSPSGRLLASGTIAQSIHIWDLARGDILRPFLEETTPQGSSDSSMSLIFGKMSGLHSVFSVAFSPDGRLLASGDSGHGISLREVATGQETGKLEGHCDLVHSVVFSPDGNLLASASWDKSIRVWNLRGRVALRIIEGHTEPVNSIAFSPDERYLASGSDDGTVGLYCLLPPTTDDADRRPDHGALR